MNSPLTMLARFADGGAVDPYAAIRTLNLQAPIARRFEQYRLDQGPDGSGASYDWAGVQNAGATQDEIGLLMSGAANDWGFDPRWRSGDLAQFGSKYEGIRDLGDGRVAVTMQRPGGHKYDTMDVTYQQGPNGWQMVGEPTMTRQVSSMQTNLHDNIDAIAPILIAAGLGAAGATYGGAGASAAEAGAAGAGSTASSGAAAQQMATTAARNALINGTLAEARGGNFMDGARAGALSGLAAPIGAAASGAATGAGFGSTAAAALGGAAAGASGAALSSAARGDDLDLDAILAGAASGGTGAGVSDVLGGGFAGSLGGRTASGVVAGRDLDDAFAGALRGTLTNPNSYRGGSSSSQAEGSMDIPETDMWTYGDDSLPETDTWDYGEPAPAAVDDFDWGSREGNNYGDPGLTQGSGGSPWNSSEPNWWDGIAEAGGGALSSIGNWLGQIWQGNPQSRNQANALLGLLGAYQAYRANSGSQGAVGGAGRLSPQQLQSMLPGNNANATWNAAQQAASQRFFTSPLTQPTQPSGATALQRYGVDPMAPKYADGGEVLPAPRTGFYDRVQQMSPLEIMRLLSSTMGQGVLTDRDRQMLTRMIYEPPPHPLNQLARPGDAYADGGEVLPARRPTDPVPGTRGPIRRPNGASPAEEAALRAVYQRGAATPPRSAASVPMPGPGAPRVTVERLRRAGEYAAGGEVMEEGPLSMLGGPQHEGPGFVMSGEGGGQDDQVDAALSPGEYVFDADVVSALGDGSNDEGARILDEMRENIRRHKRSAPPTEIPPKAKPPEAYLPS